jgi:hypothetical protein
MSAVSVTPNGATNGAKAATLKSALEASLPSVFALKAHFALEAGYVEIITGQGYALSDLKVSCIPPLAGAASTAAADVATGASASSNVLSTVQ